MRHIVLLLTAISTLTGLPEAFAQQAASERPYSFPIDVRAALIALGGEGRCAFANIDWTGREETVETVVSGGVGIETDVYLYSAEVGYMFNPADRARCAALEADRHVGVGAPRHRDRDGPAGPRSPSALRWIETMQSDLLEPL